MGRAAQADLAPELAPSEQWGRQVLDIGFMAVACAYGLTALVGLPLFQDGAWYFFKIATLGVPELPNLRYTALLPQLPTVLAAHWVEDAVRLRHLFSLSYIALPVVSLLACWLLVRRRAPGLVLFPLVWFLLNLVNFSGVSELLSSLYLSWPLVQAMLLAPERSWTRVYAGITAPMLVFLHPLAFLPAFVLALLAGALAWIGRIPEQGIPNWTGFLAALKALRWVHRGRDDRRDDLENERKDSQSAQDLDRDRLRSSQGPSEPQNQGPSQSISMGLGQDARPAKGWGWLAGLLLGAGLCRLLWTITGANHYERGRLQGDSALHYLMTETLGQHLLLGLAVLVGCLWAAAMLTRGAMRGWFLRLAEGIAWLLPAVVLLIGLEMLNGEGIKLKSGLNFVVGLLLMGLAAVVVLLCSPLRRTGSLNPMTAADGPMRTMRIASVILVCMVMLLLAKSAAWWTATRGLQALIAGHSGDCITLSATEPFGLQWPWMRIIDDWATPMNALAFRPYLVLDPEQGIQPVPLLLRHDRCTIARETGQVFVTSWIERDLETLNQRFGPLTLVR
jgi:hypothetical protein